MMMMMVLDQTQSAMRDAMIQDKLAKSIKRQTPCFSSLTIRWEHGIALSSLSLKMHAVMHSMAVCGSFSHCCLPLAPALAHGLAQSQNRTVYVEQKIFHHASKSNKEEQK